MSYKKREVETKVQVDSERRGKKKRIERSGKKNTNRKREQERERQV